LPYLGNNPERYYAKIVCDWLASPKRAEMLLADRYYRGYQDILNRQRLVIDASGKLSPVDNLPNNRLVDNQYRKLVDQKTNYALGKPLTIATSDDAYLAELNKIFDKKMSRQLRVLGQYAIDGGIAWLHPYYNELGEFKTKVFPSYEVCPIWTDNSHTELDTAIRIYSDKLVLNNGNVQDVTMVEVYTVDGVDRYVYDGSALRPHETAPHINYLQIGDQDYNWTRIPLIAFKYNALEIPLIRNVKSLQDSLNQVLSDFQNNMEESPRNSILVLKNYDGTNIPEFRQNLATYGVVKVKTVDGVQGGIDTLAVEVDSSNYQAILMQLKRAIVENGRGFDAKEERMDGDPNQMNIESMYTDIDLDVNAMESEFQAGFEDLKWFIDQHLQHIGLPDYSDEEVEFVFNRDIFINEDAKIENCVKSVGIVSAKTILAHHPWVTDLQHELTQLEEDKQAELEEMEQMNAFQNNSGGSNAD
jgi:SPP1 family phage portal protein